MRRPLASIAAAFVAIGMLAASWAPAFAIGPRSIDISRAVKLDDQWAGRVGGTAAYISVFTLSNRRAGAYLADGADIAPLVLGKRSGKRIELRPTDGTTVSAIIEDGTVTGTVTIGDSRHEYVAERSTGDSGWYRGRKKDGGTLIAAGFIVLSDGSSRGAVRRGGALIASPDFDPANLTIDLPTGETIKVLPVAAFVKREQRLA